MDIGESERRSGNRFPIETALEYKVILGENGAEFGSGQTINLSSGGILFRSDRTLPQGVMIELKIDWPASLSGTAGLILRVVGRTLRSEATNSAVRILRHEFHTRKRP